MAEEKIFLDEEQEEEVDIWDADHIPGGYVGG